MAFDNIHPTSRQSFIRVAGTLVLAVLAALLCVYLRTPLPWMIGPMLATALASMAGLPTEGLVSLRNAGQWVIGAALGLYFTPQVVGLLLGLWWVIGLGVLWAFALAAVFSAYLYHFHSSSGVSRKTAYFASAIGAASEMTLMAEKHGAQPELVAAAHSLRVLLVTLIVPFGLQWSGWHGIDISVSGPRGLDWSGLLLLGMLTGAGCWVMVKLKRTNPWFIGPLLVSIAVTAWGYELSAVPLWLTGAAQLVIGISLGVRFTREFFRHAPRWLGSVALATLAMLSASALFAWGLTGVSGLHPATLLLSTAPGGIAEMAITAKVLQLGVPVVTAFQVTRLVAVLTLTEPLYRLRYLKPLKV
jgi:membrane AbrB-like protein